ncbi:hypothetical protein [Crystallibacter degradans]|uniref:hypothetical protein n=1 Tax=Crystallibacter degradans TaxID=2726743 RepID=UPI0014758D04|nr:hypothetical protein [Arthrobacter sp. SF27]NMR29942.1 hypothetical protein [Arthrobacter sp. SF27]
MTGGLVSEAIGDPCAMCPDDGTASDTAIIGDNGRTYYVCLNCELLLVRFDMKSYTRLMLDSFTQGHPRPWWIPKRTFRKLNARAEGMALAITNHFFKRLAVPVIWKDTQK